MTSTLGIKKIQYPNGTDILTLDSSGSMAISGTLTGTTTIATASVTGNTTVGGTLGVTGTATLSGNATIGTNSGDTRFSLNSANQYTMVLKNAGNIAGQIGGGGADDLRFSNAAGSTTMQIKDGKVCVNGTTTGGDMMKINNSGGSGYWALNLNSAGGSDKILISAQSGTGLVTHHQFNNSNGEVGTIKTLNSATNYNTSSDYRLKENVSYNFDATTRLKQLKPARFNFISDETNTLVDGFIAHEVSSIVPQAVMGEKDAMETYTDSDGKEQTRISPQSIDHSKLVPLLVKTIQELEARITELESK